MDRIQIDTAQNVALNLDIAGLGDRVIAALIDYAILGAYTFGTLILILILIGTNPDIQAFLGTLFLFASLPLLLYFLLCEIFLSGQSIGKRFMNIRVVRMDGTSASLGDYLLRWLLRPIDLLLTSGVGAVTTVLVTGTGQRLGDLAAGTTVVRARSQATVRTSSFAGSTSSDAAASTPTFPEVDRLSDDDAATAREMLDALKYSSRSHQLQSLGRRTKAALETKMRIASDHEPRPFLEQVVADYTHRFGSVKA